MDGFDLTENPFDNLKLSMFEYIHSFYNFFKPHSHNNGLSPDQAEINFLYILLFFLSKQTKSPLLHPSDKKGEILVLYRNFRNYLL